MLDISVYDERIVDDWKKWEVLVHVEGHRLDQRNGVILVTCGDADQSYDIFQFHARLQEGQCDSPRIHLCAWNGGALRLMPGSLVNKNTPNASIMLMQEIQGARVLKSINTVALYCHIPCGMAYANGMNAKDVLGEHMEAKRFVRSQNEGADLACFTQICRHGERNSYFVQRQRWHYWLANRWPGLQSELASL